MKKISNQARILKYIAKHPDAKATEISEKLNIGKSYVYLVMSKSRSEAKVALAKKEFPKSELADFVFAMTRGRKPQRMKHIAKDNVNQPEHYKVGGIETIDFIEAKQLGYHLGNVVKYITRADHKGNHLEDLKKAQWYLNRAVANLEK
jgi:hypothetical protein